MTRVLDDVLLRQPWFLCFDFIDGADRRMDPSHRMEWIEPKSMDTSKRRVSIQIQPRRRSWIRCAIDVMTQRWRHDSWEWRTVRWMGGMAVVTMVWMALGNRGSLFVEKNTVQSTRQNDANGRDRWLEHTNHPADEFDAIMKQMRAYDPHETTNEPPWNAEGAPIPGISYEKASEYLKSPNQDAMPPPKIAFLFLTRGPMELEMLWQLFFTDVPKELYNVYLHPAPGYHYNETTTKTDVFVGREIPSQTVDWGQMSMIDAEKRLLRAGLEDPANQRFILLSESCIPLHSFSFVYDYLMGQTNSYIESYQTNLPGRYDPRMAPTVREEDFRKGGQWFALRRDHAQLVYAEEKVYEVFQEHCYWDWGLNKLCAPDETYIQTTLAVLGRENEIHRRSVTFTEWYPTTRVHPKRYVIQEVSRDLIWDLQSRRQIWGPDIHPQQRTLHPLERPLSYKLGGGQYRPETNIICQWGAVKYAPCWLFARKFSAKGGQRLLRYATSVHLGNLESACSRFPLNATESCSILGSLNNGEAGQQQKPYTNHFYDPDKDRYLVRGIM